MIIDILSTKYRFRKVKQEELEKNQIGQIDYFAQDIKILKELNTDMSNVTLLHEIIHGILNGVGKMEDCRNEELIDCLATGIYSLLKNNKSLIKSMMEDK